MRLRFHSARAPYRRGGLAFRDRLEPVLGAAIALTLDGLRELIQDPVITRIEVEVDGDFVELDRAQESELGLAVVSAIQAGDDPDAGVALVAGGEDLQAELADLRAKVAGFAAIEEKFAADIDALVEARDALAAELKTIETERDVIREERDDLRGQVNELTARLAAPSPAKAAGGKGPKAKAD